MIRDRGRIKWTAMMLPEHVKLLRDWQEEELWEEKRELDEQRLEQLNEVVREAQTTAKKVSVYYYTNHHSEIITGIIREYYPLKQELKLIEEQGTNTFIPLTAITNIEIID
ncbi:YolD-like family protein [Bacillus kwashiorkori]|uniref:YolD-like family protein n=1 Tax=Bacillus kwashiorkori TaxID=1522318 RepID=UPI0007808A96|nr:YolD-like family protein [Bacillus kwashiorkori]